MFRLSQGLGGSEEGSSSFAHSDRRNLIHSNWGFVCHLEKYGGGYVWIKLIEGRVNAVSYVLKYVNKTILGVDKTYAALLFASNKRMFSMSRGLRDKLGVSRKIEK